ncbi:hypothetical protein [Tistrella mobilis]|uniref:hypothetical protein n=1 Tax=Tistrella mobilis TaxID=171437 RepID=UPI003555ECCB
MSVFLAALLITTPGAMAQDEPALELGQDGFREIVRPSALISGAIVTGVQVYAAAQDDISMRGFVPRSWAGESVCASVLTINGLYEATATYRIPAEWPGGIALLPFPTVHADILSNAGSDGLSIRVSRNACGAELGRDMSFALWNGGGGNRLTVLLNSFRADAVYLYVAGRETPVRCRMIDLPARSAFDVACDLSVDGLAGPTRIEILRMVERKVAPPTDFVLWLPQE